MTKIALTIDCTMSMHEASYVVQREVEKFIGFILDRLPNLKLAIVCHGDEVDPKIDTTTLDFTNDRNKLIEFIRKMPRYGPNGTEEEFYQVVQKYVLHNLSWGDEENKAYIFIGDATPRKEARFIPWRSVAIEFPTRGIQCFNVQCLDRLTSQTFWNEFTNYTSGKLLKLNQFSNLPELLTTLFLYTESIPAAQEYSETLVIGRDFRNTMNSLFGKITEPTDVHPQALANGLVPVHPSRFQILKVWGDQEIQSFVNNTGASFKPGKGFYQLKFTEKVNGKKEIILVDRITGDMFTGASVRNLMNLPYGTSGKLSKKDIPEGYDCYVQSTSYNRKLDSGTNFLYEVDNAY